MYRICSNTDRVCERKEKYRNERVYRLIMEHNDERKIYSKYAIE